MDTTRVPVLLAVLLTLATVACGDGDDGAAGSTSTSNTTPTSIAATTTTAAGAATSTTVARAAAPATVVSTTADGRLLVTTGARTMTASLGTFRAPRVAITPDGKAAYLELWDEQQRTRLQRWDLTGPPVAAGATFAPDARFPAVSPDGRKLAYSKGRFLTGTLVVRDIGTGSEKAWQWPESRELQSLSWAADNRRLAIEDGGGGDSGTVIFDTSRAAGPVPQPKSIGGPYHRAVFRGGQDTLVASQPEPGGLGADKVVEVDASSGAVRRTLVSVTPDIKFVRADPTGDHLLIVTQNDVLFSWSTGGQLSQRATGVLDADW